MTDTPTREVGLAGAKPRQARTGQQPARSPKPNSKPRILPAGPPIFTRFQGTGLLGPEDIASLCESGWRRSTVAARQSLSVESNFCVLASGLAARYRQTQTEESHSVSLIIPGDICDYSLITGTNTHSRLAPLTGSSLLHLPAEDAVSLFEQVPNVLAAVLTQLATDQAVTEELLFSLARRTALERAAHLLCELEFRFRRMGLSTNGRFSLPMTQAEIGKHLGLTSVHVNRTLQELRRRELVNTQGTNIELPDLSELQRLAGFDPRYLTVSKNRGNGASGEERHPRPGPFADR